MESCAACDRTDASLKACKSCNLVKYCNVNCQRAHWSKHKQACKKRAAELFHQKLYAEPPRREDCPICMLLLPLSRECVFMSCCGKFICEGCAYHLARGYCPFCNASRPRSPEENNKRLMERVEKYNDPEAICALGNNYSLGQNEFLEDSAKAVELYQRASDLGCVRAHYNLANMFLIGNGVGMDKKKFTHHCQIAAMAGHEHARRNLGFYELQNGNMRCAYKHFMISAKCGDNNSMDEVKKGFKAGVVTKQKFEETMRGHQAACDEIRSEQRDRAKAARGLLMNL